MSTAPFLPYGRHTIEEDDIAAVVAALRSDFLTCGPAVEAFEAAFARRVGARFAVSCASGTAALHLAALALDLGPGDAVIVPTMTFLATANAARYVGAEVVFADVDADTGLLTPATLAEALTRCGTLRPRAVFPVHLAGQPCDMAGIGALAAAHGLAVVEDACHALGGEDRGVPIGSCPDSRAACFSLHPVKAVAMGEG
ncbi:MAG: aminotransferase class I/II-fold pyridoxal phosphate-dependent enzyme, partial [Magnetospirillum sp.]|nr:aminotransferase class I/II-fold pyridoxal phosphate-dependent enzyme [Magnetospirillum sp.]